MSGLHRKNGLNRKTPLVAKTELQQRQQLKRSGYLETTKPLKAGSYPLARGVPMPQKPSEKQRRRADAWAEVKAEAWDAWGGQCAVGYHPLPWDQMHGHHRRLKSAGGLDLIENCLPVCDACHRYIHGLGDAAYDAGWLVRAWLDPADVPIIGLS